LQTNNFTDLVGTEEMMLYQKCWK